MRGRSSKHAAERAGRQEGGTKKSTPGQGPGVRGARRAALRPPVCEVLLCRGHHEFCTLGDAVGPALHDALLARIEAYAFLAIGMAVAEEAGLPAAKAVPRHGYRNGYVHAHHADFDATPEFAGDAAVARVEADAVGVLVAVDEVDGIGEGVDAHARQHRAEDFFLVDAHVGRYVVEQRTTQPEPAFAAFTGGGGVEVAAVDHQRCTFLHALLDIAGDALERSGMHDGAHFRFQVEPVANLECAGAFGQDGNQTVADVAHQHTDGDRHAAFAGRTITGADECVGHLFEIGVGHDHHVVLRTAQRLHPLAVARTGFVDVVRNGRRADEGHRLDVGMHQDGVYGFLVALHHVEYAVGQAGLFEQIGQHQRGGRVDGAGFQNEAVAGGDGQGEHPQRHHGREVERRDAGYDAQRLAQGPVVDAGGNLVGEVGFQQLGNAAGELDDVDATRDFALGVGEQIGRAHV